MIPKNYMPIVAKCPSCGASLSETSVLALAPVCGHCGSVITKSGGTLGLTSAYGVNDPNITRKRVEADLAVFCDYRDKYVGMLEACKEQLNWGVERYAKLPNSPELLSLVDVPPLWTLPLALALGFVVAPCTMIILGLLSIPIMIIVSLFLPPNSPWQQCNTFDKSVLMPLVMVAFFVPLTISLFRYCRATIANGTRPSENVRRQKAYEEACAAALKAAEPVKAAQDHRLRSQICELEGLITTMTEKAEDVRRILRTL